MTDTNPGMTPELSRLLLLVAAERQRQDDKFGPQDYPLIDPNAPYAGLASAYKQLNDRAIKNGTRTGDSVLLEEVYEALSAQEPAQVVTELVQVAAVALLLAEMQMRKNDDVFPHKYVLAHDPHRYVQEVPGDWMCKFCDYGPGALHHRSWIREGSETLETDPLSPVENWLDWERSLPGRALKSLYEASADPESPMSRQEVKNLTAHTRYGGPVTVDQTSLSTNSYADLAPADWDSNAPAGFPGPEPYDQGGYRSSDRSAEQDD